MQSSFDIDVFYSSHTPTFALALYYLNMFYDAPRSNKPCTTRVATLQDESLYGNPGLLTHA
jgi:hypothetical protein